MCRGLYLIKWQSFHTELFHPKLGFKSTRIITTYKYKWVCLCVRVVITATFNIRLVKIVGHERLISSHALKKGLARWKNQESETEDSHH